MVVSIWMALFYRIGSAHVVVPLDRRSMSKPFLSATWCPKCHSASNSQVIVFSHWQKVWLPAKKCLGHNSPKLWCIFVTWGTGSLKTDKEKMDNLGKPHFGMSSDNSCDIWTEYIHLISFNSFFFYNPHKFLRVRPLPPRVGGSRLGEGGSV